MKQHQINTLNKEIKDYIGDQDLTIYETCVIGFDDHDTDMAIIGVEPLFRDIMKFLTTKGKDIIMLRALKSKDQAANYLIFSTTISVIPLNFMPGAIITITTVQVGALIGLNYIYKQENMSVKEAATLIGPILSSISGYLLYNSLLSILSFVPGGNILSGTIGSATSVPITISLLLAAKFILRNGYSLNEANKLLLKFNEIKNNVEMFWKTFKESKKLPSAEDFYNVIKKIEKND